MKVAALDLGTNTFLCLIVEGDEKNGIRQVLADHAQVVRLGQDIAKTGRLHPEALARANACLTEFKKAIDHHKVDRILAMATSAARDAENGEELFQIGRDLQIPIEIIPGESEAQITYQGATVGSSGSERNLVVDVGGGSTEFILGQAGKILFGESLNIGGVRLTEKYITQQPVPPQEQSFLESFIEKEVDKIRQKIHGQKIDKILAVAGTPTSIVAIEVGGYQADKVDGYFLSRERLQHWVKEFSQTTVEEKKSKYDLGGRADIIFAGSMILLKTIELFQQPGMWVSIKGVRYGVALEIFRRSAAGL